MSKVRLTVHPAGVSQPLLAQIQPRAASIWLGSLWVLGLAALPVYVGASGSVQPGHAIMAVAAILTLTKHPPQFDRLWHMLCLLDTVILLRCGWEVQATGDFRELTPAAFFLFNTICVLALRTFVERENGMRFLCRGIVAAIVVAVAGIFLFGVREFIGTSTRIAGTFNNPNQLGYFSTCIGGLLATACFSGYLSPLLLFIGLLVSGFLAMISLSKAAMVAAAIGIGLSALSLRRTSVGLIVGGLALLAILMLLTSNGESGAFDEVAAVRRLRLIGDDSDDSLEARGYGLLVSNDPRAILFGRGYSEVYDALGHEVHSTLGSMWVNYGAVGWLIFVGFLGVWCRSLHARYGLLRALAIATPPMLYGLTHNGTRATIFWVLVAVAHARVSDRTRQRSGDGSDPGMMHNTLASPGPIRLAG